MQPLQKPHASTVTAVSTKQPQSTSSQKPEKCLTCRCPINSILSLPQHLIPSTIVIIPLKSTKPTMLPIWQSNESLPQMASLVHLNLASFVAGLDTPLHVAHCSRTLPRLQLHAENSKASWTKPVVPQLQFTKQSTLATHQPNLQVLLPVPFQALFQSICFTPWWLPWTSLLSLGPACHFQHLECQPFLQPVTILLTLLVPMTLPHTHNQQISPRH